PMRAHGVQIRQIEQINGKNEFCEVFLDEVMLTEDALIGSVDKGWGAASDVLSVERGANKLYRQASFLVELQAIQRYRRQHSDRLTEQKAVEIDTRIAELYSHLTLVRYRNFALINAMLRGEQPGYATSAHKLYWSEMHQDI